MLQLWWVVVGSYRILFYNRDCSAALFTFESAKPLKICTKEVLLLKQVLFFLYDEVGALVLATAGAFSFYCGRRLRSWHKTKQLLPISALKNPSTSTLRPQ